MKARFVLPERLRLTILDRYLFQELGGGFAVGVAIFSILLMAIDLLFPLSELLVKYRVPVLVLLEYFLSRIPGLVLYTLPMAMLLGTLLTFARFSGDHEILAMKAGGISFYRILVPVLVFAAAVVLIGFLLNDQVVPRTTFLANSIMESQMRKKNPMAMENVTVRTKTQEGFERITFARYFDERTGTLIGTIIHDFTPEGELARSTVAKETLWKEGVWEMQDGMVLEFAPDGKVDYYSTFKTAVLELPQTPGEVSLFQKRPEEMRMSELKRMAAVMKKINIRDALAFTLQYHMKLAIPFASLVFACIGVPFGLRPHRSAGAVGVGLSMIIVFAYYVVTFVAVTLGKASIVSPGLASWFPNTLFLSLGLYFIQRAA